MDSTNEVSSNSASEKEFLNLGKPDKTETKKLSNHVPSTVLPDTLFTFTDQLKWMMKSLQQKMISPRYCEEPLGYLGIRNLKSMAFPMKCFCDINLHKLGIHMDWYGYYGLALSKDWGMKHKIQPIQYLNEDSELRKDFSTAFRSMLRENETDIRNETKTHTMLKNYLLHDLMYFKPYQGMFVKRTTQKRSRKCFADECEWRFIPNVSVVGMPQIITQNDLIGSVLEEYNNSLDGRIEVSLPFDYSELKYVIVEYLQDFYALSNAINEWGLSEEEKYTLLSKVMVWENSEGDF